MKKSQHALVLFLALTVAAPHAFAQATGDPVADPASVEEARHRFQRGVELYREGSFDAALAEFNKAYQLAPNYRVLYNLAQVQTERHDYIAAVKMLEQYLKQGANEIPPERREQVEQELRALKGRVSELVVSTNVQGAELLVDGASMGELPAKEPIVVNSGVRRLMVRKTGYTTTSRSVTIAGGEAVRLEFELTKDPAAATSGGQLLPYDFKSQQVDDTPANVPFWISLVATGLFTGGAVTFGVLARQSDEELDKKLDEYPPNVAGIDDTRSELKRNALLTDAFAAAAVVGAGFTVYFAFNAPEKASAEKDSARTKPSPRLGVGTMGTGLRLTGQF
jgi:hypothetical protein